LQKKSHSSLFLWLERFGDEPIVLASLVRAGVPLGVMLHQALRDMGKPHGITASASSGIVELTVQHSTSLKSGMVPAVLSLLTDGQVKAQLPESLYAH
jgi:hypothetical protein